MTSLSEKFYVVSRASYCSDPHRQPCDGASYRADAVPDGRSLWQVEIPSLREFIKKEGQCVLTLIDNHMDILIYDDYIE